MQTQSFRSNLKTDIPQGFVLCDFFAYFDNESFVLM